MSEIYFPKLAGQLADLYLEWWNDWLTIERFAEFHGVSVSDATALINMGREYHNQRAARIKAVNEIKADLRERGGTGINDLAKSEEVPHG